MAKRKTSLKKVSDDKLLAALISNPTITGAAKSCGISARTIYKRLENDAFKKQYRELSSEVLHRSAITLQNGITEAAETMREVLLSEESSPQVKLNAADAIIRNSMKLNEQLQIIDRISKIEQTLQEMRSGD